jgi:hypothetical protein
LNLSDSRGQAGTEDISGQVAFVDNSKDRSHCSVAVFGWNFLRKVHGWRHDQKRNALVASPDEEAGADGEKPFGTSTDRFLHSGLNGWAEELGVLGVDPTVHEAIRVGRGNDRVPGDCQDVAARACHIWNQGEGSIEFFDQVWVRVYEMKSHVASPPNALPLSGGRPSAADHPLQRLVRRRPGWGDAGN